MRCGRPPLLAWDSLLRFRLRFHFHFHLYFHRHFSFTFTSEFQFSWSHRMRSIGFNCLNIKLEDGGGVQSGRLQGDLLREWVSLNCICHTVFYPPLSLSPYLSLSITLSRSQLLLLSVYLSSSICLSSGPLQQLISRVLSAAAAPSPRPYSLPASGIALHC